MNSLLRLILLVELLCFSTGLAFFGQRSPQLRSLKSSSGDDDYKEATATEEDKANAFESVVRSVSGNKQCELLSFEYII